MKHYTKEELELFRNGQMSILGRLRCSAHLKECHECSKVMEELKEDDNLISEVRGSVQLYKELSMEK
jgi:hypothetical protein